MGCIGLLRSRAWSANEDVERLLRAFVHAAGAVGPDGVARTPRVHDGGEGSFHVVLSGDDSLDCHAYPLPVSFGAATMAALRGRPEVQAAVEAHVAQMWVESSPVDLGQEASRRVALAVADLIDEHVLVLADYQSNRMVLCGGGTAAILRSAGPAEAFAGGVTFELG